MKICYPEYGNCIANLACSVMRHFGVENVENPTLPLVDSLLHKEYKNIVVLLLDGMGQCILERNLSGDGFLNSHIIDVYSSVFPPTTVAATTSIDSGLYPSQHGWLGWDCYYPQIDQTVTVYRNRITGTAIPAAEYSVARKFCPYESVIERIQKAGGEAYYATPFQEPYPADLNAVCDRIQELCVKGGKKYIYAYWTQPDSVMHEKGCYAEESVEELKQIEQKMKELASHLEDTLLLITADHGHMDSDGCAITEHPEILECLERVPSIEPRALNLFVKAGCEERFEKLWEERFQDVFMLLPKQEILDRHLFGIGQRKDLTAMLGEYLAVAVADYSVYHSQEEKESFIGVHAGLTEDEMRIPLIAIEC